MYRLGRHLAIWGSVLQLGLLAGPAVTVVLMIQTFADIAQSSGTDPSDLAPGVLSALMGTVVGLAVSCVGFVGMAIAVLVCKYRTPWLHSVLWAVAVLWLFSALPLGLALMVGLAAAGRRAFQPSEQRTDAPETSVVSGASVSR